VFRYNISVAVIKKCGLRNDAAYEGFYVPVIRPLTADIRRIKSCVLLLLLLLRVQRNLSKSLSSSALKRTVTKDVKFTEKFTWTANGYSANETEKTESR